MHEQYLSTSGSSRSELRSYPARHKHQLCHVSRVGILQTSKLFYSKALAPLWHMALWLAVAYYPKELVVPRGCSTLHSFFPHVDTLRSGMREIILLTIAQKGNFLGYNR